MPSMYVNVPRLEQETKNTLVAKLYDAAAPVLKAPITRAVLSDIMMGKMIYSIMEQEKKVLQDSA